MKVWLRLLLRHMRWADERTVASLRELGEAPEDAVRIFSHCATAERVHLARMRGEDPFPQDFWPDISLADAASMAASAVDGWFSMVADQDAAELDRPVRYRNSSGTYFATAPSEMLIHLAMHGEHHRGQIARLVREGGGKPAVTDFVVFLRESTRPDDGGGVLLRDDDGSSNPEEGS